MIQGAAGSGKTSVALHRIAYLLYHDRQNLKSSNILILSPNGVFSDYISHILPELGEENIQEMSFDLFAYRKLQGIVADCEDRCDQMERMLSFTEEDPLWKVKESKAFLDQMEGFVLELEDELMNFKDMNYKNVSWSSKEIWRLFYEKLGEIPLLSRMDSVAESFIDEVETVRNKDLSPEEKEELKFRFRMMYETTDLYVLYNRYLKQNGYPLLPDVPPEQRCLKYEDVYPMLYLKYRLYRQQERSGIRHVVVDEMQDYSVLQYRILRQMFSCRMTILGDRAQTMDEEPRDVLKFLPKIFGRDIRKIVMKKSYRNTVEISEYANALGNIRDIEVYQRHGKPVEETEVPDWKEALDQALQNLNIGSGQYETAAVIFASAKEAEQGYDYLKERMEAIGMETENVLSLLHKESVSFQKGLTVTTFYLAKGLEFDQVFAVFQKNDRRPLLSQARYIAATRALHELFVYEITK